jgi:glyoxylase-like metal-dependent hydrolase (beta-lactamase superfamily II)
LGTIGKIERSSPKHSKQSGILIDNSILLDLGEKEYLDLNPKAIFITHLHPDHAFFIGNPDLNDVGVPIFAPESHEDFPIIKVLDEKIQVKSCQITPIPTHHSKLVKSQAYLIEREKRMLYTGDLIWINKEYHNLLQNLDLVITDGGFKRRGGMIRKDKETDQLYGHNGIPDLIDFFKHFTDYIMFTHFGSWFFEDIKKSEKFIKDIDDELRIEVAYDGYEITI